ncbi:DNA-processing protein DprA [Streptomyces sp. HU2014]|uniref:DNA protecting protein DprA n=1 Tax=Streptomyces albireticuli TaxID=1940 RepID=A0A1Z2L078_9ACTN|nr:MULTISPECIES: DNA-processing protein DprA [Streptomyces]ARZ67611.1 DNA protecting protein DprA [Streptomyces albireticuli]UQI47643.1 DNA-processing protein DprA [Streptomyces sp. HU2014]
MTAPAPDRLARAALTRLTEPGDERVGRWLREMGAEALARGLTGAGPAPPGAGEERLAGCRARAAALDPRGDLDAIARLGGRFLVPGDAEWPRQLDDLGDARPLGLWVRGTADLRLWALRSVAVVGARACTDYGSHVATILGAGLAERGWVVVSGAAFGVDGAAHRGALAAGGATVAVLASGVDVPYPRGHAELIDRITEQGLVLAELPPGGHPTRSRFVLRNRVIAALTRGTVVVEAQYRSGSLVTARCARRLGRHTMGVPGPVTSGLSAGVHELLREEAHLVTDADEIAELVGGMGELAPERRGPVVARDLLPPATATVLDAVPGGAGGDLARIARNAGLSRDRTLGGLYELQGLGFVERHGDHWKLAGPPSTSGTPKPLGRRPTTRRGGS